MLDVELLTFNVETVAEFEAGSWFIFVFDNLFKFAASEVAGADVVAVGTLAGVVEPLLKSMVAMSLFG